MSRNESKLRKALLSLLTPILFDEIVREALCFRLAQHLNKIGAILSESESESEYDHESETKSILSIGVDDDSEYGDVFGRMGCILYADVGGGKSTLLYQLSKFLMSLMFPSHKSISNCKLIDGAQLSTIVNNSGPLHEHMQHSLGEVEDMTLHLLNEDRKDVGVLLIDNIDRLLVNPPSKNNYDDNIGTYQRFSSAFISLIDQVCNHYLFIYLI